jgi:CXXC-20-CXXC protein
LQKCKKCQAPFSWRKIYRTICGFVYQPLICDKYGAEHWLTISGRLVSTLLVIGPMTIFAGIIVPFDNIYFDLGGGIALAFLGSLLVPYLLTFKVDGENLYSD